jgi:glycosyltransferase involved in cell wall biosynthesis
MLGNRETGNETYVRGLLDGLATLEGVAVAAAVQRGYRADPRAPAGITWLTLPTRSSVRRLGRDLALLASRWQADVIHATYIAPFRASSPVVISVHDVSFKRYPEYFSLRDRVLFTTLLPGSLRRAAAVLTLSSHARDELLRFYPGLRTPIYIVPAAPGASFRPLDREASASAMARVGVRRPFLLAVGSLQPRKNLVRLVEAFRRLHSAQPDVQLVIVGPGGFRSEWVERTIVSRGLSEAVLLPGYLPEEDLIALYNGAIALVYPSVYEGFGLPVVEAMACGCPVIAANTSSLPEVAGDAAILVDPFDASALHAAMLDVVTDARRSGELGARGIARAAHFSWARTAAAALAAYRAARNGNATT